MTIDNLAPAFTLSLPGLSEGQDTFDLWQVPLPTSSLPPATDTTGEIGSVWRAELPEDLLEAARLLDFHQNQLQQTRKALPAASQRLPVDLEAIIPRKGPESFSPGAGWSDVDPASPVGVLQSAVQYRWGDSSSSFFLDQFQLIPGQLEEVVQTVSRFSDQVRRTVEQLALVETSIGGNTIGVTRVTWTGDTDTWWAAGTGPEKFSPHAQVLSQALATRQHWLHFLLIVTSGAVRVGAALATGPFTPIAIWTTWNYALQVVAEFRNLPVHAANMPNP